MKQKSRTGLIAVLLIGIVILLVLIAGMLRYLNGNIFISGKAYPNDAERLDLRNQKLSVGEYEKLCAAMPGSEIIWDVPFQNTRVSNYSKSLNISTLSENDLQMLRYFPMLEQIDANGCREYALLEQLRQQHPELQVEYTVPVAGKEYSVDAETVKVDSLTREDIEMMEHMKQLKHVDATDCRDCTQLSALRRIHPEVTVSYRTEVLGKALTQEDTSVVFQSPDVERLMEELNGAVSLEAVHMEEPVGSAETLVALTEVYPQIVFTWNKTVLDKTFSSMDSEIDFSKMPLDSTDPVEEAMKYFPYAEKVIMSDCGIDNETMAEFREKMRPEYKVVWTVYVTKKPIRTDSTVIHSSALKVCFIDEQSYDLKYCEDAVIVDIGHSYVKYIEWVRYMPELKYLIIADNWIKDLSPIADCKKLEYLEIFDNKHLPDYTPLLGCTALKDLNISGTFADPAPLMQMTWLETLWAGETNFSAAERNALTNALPNTRVVFNHGYTGGGWRDVQGYHDMRDMMGLDHNTW